MTFEEAIHNIKKWLACINRDDLNCLRVCDSCQNHVDAETLYESLTVIVADAKKKTDEDKQLTKWLEELQERRKQPEQKTGVWLTYTNIPQYMLCKCSACGADILVPYLGKNMIFNYCPNCGAKMEGDLT